VIVHELAHLIEANHTSHFWGIVRAKTPTMEKAKAWFGRWAKGGGGVRAWEAFAPFLSGVPELRVPTKVSAPAAQLVDLSAAASARASVMRDAAHDRTRVPLWSATSVTSESRHVTKIARSAESEPDDPTYFIVADTPSHHTDAGASWGTLIHGLLEHAMRHKDATREDLRRLAMWLTVEEPELRSVIDEALDTVEHAAKGEFWSAAKAAPECHQEVPFMYKRARPFPN
jgi:ATP-dependent exoDNAse (exonuclease V) beta subunit